MRHAIHYPKSSVLVIKQIKEIFYQAFHFTPTYSQIFEAAIYYFDLDLSQITPPGLLRIRIIFPKDKPYITIRISEENHNKIAEIGKKYKISISWAAFLILNALIARFSNGTGNDNLD